MSTIIKLFAGISLFIGSIFAPHATAPTQTLGAFNPIQTQVFFLSGSGINSTQTSTLLTSMEYVSGAPVTMADLGSIGFATIDPGNSNEEQISFTGILQNSNGTALLTGVTRGLAFNPGTQGCNGSSTLAVAHAGAAQLVLSNTACFYQQYAALSNTSTITGAWNFSSTVPTTNLSTSTVALGTSNLATVGYVNSVSLSGAPSASTSTPGNVLIANQTQIYHGLASSPTKTVPPTDYFNSVASTSPVAVVASGTIDPSFLSNGNYSLGSTTVQSLTSASTTLNGTTTVSNLVLPNATSSVLTTNASGSISALIGSLFKYSLLTASSGTWTDPSGVTSIYVTMCAAGGNGGGSPTNQTYGGAGGSGGDCVYKLHMTIGGNISYTIGQPGATSTGTGNVGGNTTFNSFSVTGGNGGGTGGGSSPAGGTSVGLLSQAGTAGSGQKGGDCLMGLGAAATSTTTGNAGNGYCAGGGGGVPTGGSSAIGGLGAPGIIIVEY